MLFTAKDSFEDVFKTLSHELHRGALDTKHPFRFVSFATINNQQPDLRYVVLRALDEKLHFYFYTDSRSGKVGDINRNPAVSLLFYHPGKRVQVKVMGRAALHQEDELAAEHWGRVQGDARKAYNTLLAPGTPIATPIEAYHWQDPLNDKHFCLIEVIPKTIEGLQLQGNTHIRMESSLDGGKWQFSWLNP